MATTITEVLNTTVYDSDDVIRVIDHTVSTIGGSSSKWDSLKIRYLIKPRSNRRPKDDQKWAKVLQEWGSSALEVALLRPDKIGVLDAIALSQDGVAHHKIVEDLAEEIKKLLYGWRKSVDTTGLKIRISGEVDDKAKTISAHRNLEKRLKTKSRVLAGKRAELQTLKKRLAQLEKEIPKDQKDLDKIQERFEKSKNHMKSSGYL